MNIKTRLMKNDLVVLYVGIYGILIQIIAIPYFYFFPRYFQTDSALSMEPTLIYIWYLFPILALLPITLAILQIRQRKAESRSIKKPMAGLIVNVVWILGIIVFIAVGLSF